MVHRVGFVAEVWYGVQCPSHFGLGLVYGCLWSLKRLGLVSLWQLQGFLLASKVLSGRNRQDRSSDLSAPSKFRYDGSQGSEVRSPSGPAEPVDSRPSISHQSQSSQDFRRSAVFLFCFFPSVKRQNKPSTQKKRRRVQRPCQRCLRCRTPVGTASNLWLK